MIAPQPLLKNSSTLAAGPTFIDHVYELRNRLFWTVACVLAGSAAAFPLKEQILALLMAPLGNQSLYYLTPVGGFSFIIKICAYIGVLVAIPVVFYHSYRFLEPLMGDRKWRVSKFVISSMFLAVVGVIFAYTISLPAALTFLTTLDIGGIQAMLTADAYLSFVMVYLFGASLLFQMPLVLLIINSVRPLPPKQLMGSQRYVIIAAFVVSAIISPTPDIVNQGLLALPIVGMFQAGVGCIWVQNKMSRRQKKSTHQALPTSPIPVPPVAKKSPRVRLFQDITPILPADRRRSPVPPKDRLSL